MALGLVPFAGIGQQLLDAAEVLPPGTPEARRGLAIGQIVGGIFTTLGGVTGGVIGAAETSTGVGAVAGVPTMAASARLVAGGVGNIAAGIQGLMTTGSGNFGSGGASNAIKQAAGSDRTGKAFTRKGRREVIDENRFKNNGTTRCEGCGTQTVPGQQSQKGVTPPPNETNVDHVIPRVHGGQGSPVNGQVLCRTCNNKKADKMP
ncbi:MAG: HNH endonuclease [Polyangiaceae bacterium]|nr:HNH endonuclease [Polyangiaceae bacterium]